MKNHRKKCQNKNAGFTLYETLIAIVIVALSGLIIAGAISVVAKDYETVSRKNSIEMLADEYIDAIKSGLEDACIVEGDNETAINPVFESSKYGCAGSFVTSEGVVAFRAAHINYGGVITFSDELRYLIPKRNQRVGIFDNEDVKAEFIYTYGDGNFTGNLSITCGETNITKEFSCTPRKTMILD